MSASQPGAYLKSVVQDLQERVLKLRNVNKKEEINVYCDELQSQVLVSIESMITTVNQLQEQLLGEIESYRSKLVDSASVPTAGDVNSKRLKREVARLASEIEQFNVKCSTQLDKKSIDEGALQASKGEAAEFRKRAKEIRRKQRHQLFNGEFLKFNEGVFGKKSSGFFPRLETFFRDTEEDLSIKNFVLDRMSPKKTMVGPNDLGFGDRPLDLNFVVILFLSGDQVAISIQARPVLVMSLKSNRTLYQLGSAIINGTLPTMRCFAQLPNGHLAASTIQSFNKKGNVILVWNLATRKHIRTIQLPSNLILMKASPKGMLVCECGDGIRVLNLSQESKINVFKIPGSGSSVEMFEFMLNGQLVILFAENVYEIWNLESQEQVRHGQLFERLTGKSKILPNGEAVMWLSDGRALMHDLISDKPTRTIYLDYERTIDVVLTPDNSILFVHFKEFEFDLLSEMLPFCPDLAKHMLNYSPDGKLMACPGYGLTYFPIEQ